MTKTWEQVEILETLFADRCCLFGPTNESMRNKASELSNLTWRQIYKWKYDLWLRTPKSQRKCNCASLARH